MNLWHDKSYIAPSGPEWVERGYAMYDVHSVRFQFVYTEEQKEANRCAHTVADEGQALVMAAEARNSVMNPLMDAIAQNFVCYQYEDTEPAPFRSCQWDLFFWCNDFSSTLHGYGLSGRDYSYFTLTFNENQTVEKRAEVCWRLLQFLEHRCRKNRNLDVAVQPMAVRTGNSCLMMAFSASVPSTPSGSSIVFLIPRFLPCAGNSA